MGLTVSRTGRQRLEVARVGWRRRGDWWTTTGSEWRQAVEEDGAGPATGLGRRREAWGNVATTATQGRTTALADQRGGLR